MVTYRNILFCTDFSGSAGAAMPVAVDLAKKYGARLHVVHVFQEAGDLAEYKISSDIKMDWIRMAHFMGSEAEKKLDALCREVAAEAGACERKLLRGKPHVEILRYVKEAGIDLVVMSSHGLSGIEQVLFGSTAMRVLRQSPCSVLIVKKPAEH